MKSEKVAAELMEGVGGIFCPVGFATAHLEVIREPWRPVSPTEAVLTGQTSWGAEGLTEPPRVSLRDLCSSPECPFCFISSIVFLSLSNTGEFGACKDGSVYHSDGR